MKDNNYRVRLLGIYFRQLLLLR